MHKYKFSQPLEAYLEVTGIKDQTITTMKKQRQQPGVYRGISGVLHWAHTPEGFNFWDSHNASYEYFLSRITDA